MILTLSEESGLFPGVAYCLTLYYCKGEMQYRQALFYSAASIAGAFSGLLAFAIAKMDGVGGYRGWRWIFILEGLLTVIVAVAAYFLMPDYPDTAKFLTPREREFVQWRLDHDNNFKKNQISLENTEKVQRAEPNFEGFNDSNDVSLKTALFLVFKDWQILLHVLLYWGISVPTYGKYIFFISIDYIH